MREALLLASMLGPLVLIALWPLRCCRTWCGRVSVVAAVPALILAMVGGNFTIELPWILLGSRWGLDTTGKIFLGFTAVIWLAASVYARGYLRRDPKQHRFDLFLLLTMTGNVGAILAHDAVSFLMFYTLMSLAAYGLIVHDGEPESLHAGKTYLVLAVIGEVLLFWAVVLVFMDTGTLVFDQLAGHLTAATHRTVIVALLLVGFGIKLGLMPLHFWLPLAHPAAPAPASALLSGTIIKTGLLGLLRFLPLGVVTSYTGGSVCLAVGIVTALLAVLIGLTQCKAKTVLAYSSVSQMGLIAIGLGAGMMAPEAWATTCAALLLFAVHHAVTKSALFLGVGLAETTQKQAWQRWLLAAGLVLSALALAGLPFTTGLSAKLALKYVFVSTLSPWAAMLKWALPLSGFMTTLLMCRFLWLAWPCRHHSPRTVSAGMAAAWGVLTTAVVGLFLVVYWSGWVPRAWVSCDLPTAWAGSWPILAGIVVAVLVGLQPRWLCGIRQLYVPAGDLVVPLTSGLRWCRRLCSESLAVAMKSLVANFHERFARPPVRKSPTFLRLLTQALENDWTTGVIMGILALMLLLLLAL